MVPMPRVDCTRPEAPAPAPPAPPGGASGSGAGCALAEAAHAASGGALYHAGVDAAKEAARLGTLDIGVGDGQVVARNRQIEIIFQRQGDRVLQRNVKLAIAHQLVQPGRVGQIRLWHPAGRIGRKRIVGMRNGQVGRGPDPNRRRRHGGRRQGRRLRRGGIRRLLLGLRTEHQSTQQPSQQRRPGKTRDHERTASPLAARAGFAVSPTSQPSRIWMVRDP